MAKQRETFPCPVCGADVPIGAPGCRECGSDENTGWSENSEYDGLDLPDPDEDVYEDAPAPRRGWVLAVIVVCVVLLTIAALRG